MVALSCFPDETIRNVGGGGGFSEVGRQIADSSRPRPDLSIFASLGLADSAEVDMLSLRYISVNFGAEKSLG